MCVSKKVLIWDIRVPEPKGGGNTFGFIGNCDPKKIFGPAVHWSYESVVLNILFFNNNLWAQIILEGNLILIPHNNYVFDWKFNILYGQVWLIRQNGNIPATFLWSDIAFYIAPILVFLNVEIVKKSSYWRHLF